MTTDHLSPETRKLISVLESQAHEPGFVFSLAIMLHHDLFFDPEEALNIDWRSKLSFQEFTFLVGLMVKMPLSINDTPTEEAMRRQVANVYDLFERLHKAHLAPVIDSLVRATDPPADSAPRHSFDESGAVAMLTEPMFYGGSAANDFQFWELAPLKYEADAKWLMKHKRLSLPTLVHTSQRLKDFQQTKYHAQSLTATFAELCRSILDIFCFRSDELNDVPEADREAFLREFSLVPGAANLTLNSVGAYNEFESRPLILLDDGRYFMPIQFNLAQSIYESPYYWMLRDPKYHTTSLAHRGQYAEALAERLLQRVFGQNNVYKNVTVWRSKKERLTDIDVLAVDGNKALLVQVKSKRLTELARRGSDFKLREDFTEAVQKAYDQGLVSRAAILDKRNTFITSNGITLKLDEVIDDAYILCVTADHYPAVAHQVNSYLTKRDTDPDPLAMSLFDLDVMTTYLSDRFEFLYYVRQRVATSRHFRADSEIVLLAYHLAHKLYPNSQMDYEALDSSLAATIDADFPVRRGFQRQSTSANKVRNEWRNDSFNQLVDQIKGSGVLELTDAVFFLYDLSGESADELISVIGIAKSKTIRDGRRHSVSIDIERGKSGLTYVSLPDGTRDITTPVLAFAIARKHSARASVWLGLGARASSPQLVDAVVFNKQPWKPDPHLDTLSAKVLKPGTVVTPSSKKVGRNDPCPCKSGQKYKRCHGR